MSRASNLTPAFAFDVGTTIDRATIAKYDGKHPALTGATTGGKVFIHNPHDRSETNLSADAVDNLKYLSINRAVTAIACGPLNPKEPQRDILLIGTQTNLQAYDVENNKDVFNREVSDGVNSMAFGKVGALENPLALVGGNCSIQGFDEKGNEEFWTVTGDNVTALALIDIDEDGQNELLVGSEDYEIRMYQNEEIISETTETDKLIALTPLKPPKFAYALANGTVGVYEKATRVWRFKSKNQVSAVTAYDMDGDGMLEVIAGWNNGKIEVRSDRNGELVFKDTLSSSVVGLIVADYRLDGREATVACAAKGDVRGYLPIDTDSKGASSVNMSDEAVQQLLQDKQNLQAELKAFEAQLESSRKGTQDSGAIPTATKVNCHLRPNQAKGCVELVLHSTHNTVIKAAIITAEFVFGSNESCLVYTQDAQDTLVSTFAPKKDVETEMKIQVLVGFKASTHFHVSELNYKLPKFSMYVPVKEFSKEPESVVTLRVNERVNRVAMWLNNSFSTTSKQSERQTSLDIKMVSLRNGLLLQLQMSSDKGGEMKIRVNNMEVAGEIIQDLCAHLQIKEMESEAEFPEEFENFKQVLLKVDEFNAVRLKLTAEMADSSQLVKALVIKAEDARILNDMKLMKKMYSSLHDVNRELIGEYIKRATNHHELLSSLKEVNAMIQKAARLRVGQAKTRVISECRNAIKANNIQSLFRIIRYGQATNTPA